MDLENQISSQRSLLLWVHEEERLSESLPLICAWKVSQPRKRMGVESKVRAEPGGLGLKSAGCEPQSKAPRLVGHLNS